MRRLKINSKRTPKPNGKKKKIQAVGLDDEAVEQEETIEVPEQTGPAKSQANPYAKKQSAKNIPTFIDTFQSSNIDAVAYDPQKKQLWIRFKGKDVYTYFDVPLQVYRGFWSAPSKGHYFWEKIRKNPHIQYQKLTAGLRWILVPDHFSLNCNKQANIAEIMGRFKQAAKQYSAWGDASKLKNLFNGKRIDFPGFALEVVGYANKVRLNLINKTTEDVHFYSTTKVETPEVVDWIVKQVNRALQQGKLSASRIMLKAATSTNITIQQVTAALLQLYRYLQEALPEEHWTYRIATGIPELQSDHYVLSVDSKLGNELNLKLYDAWSQQMTDHYVTLDDLVPTLLSAILAVALDGTST